MPASAPIDDNRPFFFFAWSLAFFHKAPSLPWSLARQWAMLCPGRTIGGTGMLASHRRNNSTDRLKRRGGATKIADINFSVRDLCMHTYFSKRRQSRAGRPGGRWVRSQELDEIPNNLLEEGETKQSLTMPFIGCDRSVFKPKGCTVAVAPPTHRYDVLDEPVVRAMLSHVGKAKRVGGPNFLHVAVAPRD